MLLQEDPGTSISMNALRTIVKSGKVPTVQVGRKCLVCFESLLEYLKGAKPEVEPPEGKIRAVG
jgi:hypothetical protein